MSKLLDQALAYIFPDEGGYEVRALEGGGAVNMGITYTVFSAWRKAQGKPTPSFEDLKNMTVQEATDIYTIKFAAPIHFDKMPAGTGYIILDSAVNNGLGGCQRFVEETVGQPVDGKFDALTFWAASHRDPLTFVTKFHNVRLEHIKHFKNYTVPISPGKPRTWGDAWKKRYGFVFNRAQRMIQEHKVT